MARMSREMPRRADSRLIADSARDMPAAAANLLTCGHRVTRIAMSDEPADFFAPPPFDPNAARAALVRALRDLKLAERNGAFELNGQPVVKARVEGAVLKLDVAKRAARSPDWQQAQAADHAQLRRFIDDVKRRVARWNEGRDAD
jgi:hypothetical protein